MNNFLNVIDTEISIIENKLQILIYNLLLKKDVDANMYKLRIYDDMLEKFILQLDETINVDKDK